MTRTLCAVVLFLAWATASAAGSAPAPWTKWHPGHYILVPMDMSAQGYDKLLATLRESPNFRGVQKRYTWAELEPDEGNYDFGTIRQDLRRLATLGKRLVIQVQYKSFRGSEEYTPRYLRQDRFGGGSYRHGAEGRNALIWNDAVRDRLMALFSAMGRELDDEPYLEAVVIPETAPGEKQELLEAGFDEARYLANLGAVGKALSDAFPHTVTMLYANYPIRALDGFATLMQETGLGLGGPDTFTNSRNLNRGAYAIYGRLSGVVPLGIAVQAQNYSMREHRGERAEVPAAELYRFARDTLRVNYQFWLWLRQPDDFFGRAAGLIGALSSVSGGLDSACPAKRAPCVE